MGSIMRYKGLKNLLAVAFIALSLTAFAESQSSTKKSDDAAQSRRKYSGEKVSTEFGLGIGARYNWFNVISSNSSFTPKLTMPVSYGAALQFRLNIGRTFGIQPEISYARSIIKIDDKKNNFSTKAKSNIVQIPMLLSFRLAMFRLNFGPVFTLMDNTTYNLVKAEDESIQQMPLGKIYPTITYAAGISVKFAKIHSIDVRYADQFMNIKDANSYVWTLDQNKQPEAQEFRTRTRSIQLRYGVVF